MDNETIDALKSILDESLRPIKEEIAGIKTEIKDMKTEITGIKTEIVDMKTEITGIKTEIGSIKTDIKYIKEQQKESIHILKALEHKAEVNKAEHDKITYEISEIKGSVQNIKASVENIKNDLCTVEIITARNMENIAQLKVIK